MHTGSDRAGLGVLRTGPGKPGALPPWFRIGEEHVKGVEDVEGVELLRHQGKVILCRREPAVSRCQKGAANELKSLKSLNVSGTRGSRFFAAGALTLRPRLSMERPMPV